MSITLLVPDNSKILVFVSDEVFFGKDLEIRAKNGTIFPFEEHDYLFHWKTVNSTGTENCILVSGDRTKVNLKHKRLRHNINEDLLKSKNQAIRLRIREHDVRNCETCH